MKYPDRVTELPASGPVVEAVTADNHGEVRWPLPVAQLWPSDPETPKTPRNPRSQMAIPVCGKVAI